jgi:aldehyde dehydrogenase (NAD+)
MTAMPPSPGHDDASTPGTAVDAAAAVTAMRSYFAGGATRSLEARLGALSRLEALVVAHEQELIDAMHADFGKPRPEGWLTEIALVRAAIRDLRARLPGFVRPRRARVPLVQRPGRARVERQPLGCCLVVAPWNYPVQLVLIPAATALAAGNVVIAKPSELTPETSKVLARCASEAFDERLFRVIEGGAELTQALIASGVDHVFFTGSQPTGKAIMTAAAAHLTPVTLELGGKCPAFVDRDADLGVAARRIAFAKFLNAGQTCVAPDYVLVHAAVAGRFSEELERAITRFFSTDPASSADLGRIVNDAHLERLAGLLHGHGGKLLVGGEIDATMRYVAPTVILEPARHSAMMQEEIFGPILPVLSVASAAEAVREMASRPSPLAIYCFTSSTMTMRLFEAGTRSGSVSQNTAAEHFALMSLPFGGIGASGMGAYHAAAGLETFTHPRAYFRRGTTPETTLAYPPSNAFKTSILRRALRG